MEIIIVYAVKSTGAIIAIGGTFTIAKVLQIFKHLKEQNE